LVRRATIPWLLAATLVAVFLASAYGLASRLFPKQLGVFDPVASYRLEEPLTYWNALGIFAAMGVILALGFAARARSLAARVAAAATLSVLLPTIYFTFGRGAWIAGAIALAVAVALAPRPTARLAFGGVLAAVVVVGVLGVLVHYGGPFQLVRKGYHSFTTTTTATTSPVNLNRRLFTFSGSHRSELWKAAWEDYKANP